MLKISQLKLIKLKEYESKFRNSNFCEECGGNIIFIPEFGEFVCHECGLVIEESVINVSHSDKRAYTNQEINDRKHWENEFRSIFNNL